MLPLICCFISYFRQLHLQFLKFLIHGRVQKQVPFIRQSPWKKNTKESIRAELGYSLLKKSAQAVAASKICPARQKALPYTY